MANGPTNNRILRRAELESQLWKAADILRGTADAGDYKNHILGLMFLKRLSDTFDERREEILSEWTAKGRSRKEAEEVANDPDEYNVFIPENARWEYLLKVAENRAEAIDVALQAIEDQNSRYLEGVLAGVRFNDERRFGDPVEMDGLMQRLLNHFSKIPLGNRNLSDPDVLGNSYEYLIERFAEGSGKKGGEFFTPRGVVRLIVETLQPQEGMRIHDPTFGSGGMLIGCGQYVEMHGGNPRNLTLTGQEKNSGTWAIGKLNMILHNFLDSDLRLGDTLRNPKFVDHGSLNVWDRVIANPPFSLDQWGYEEMAESGDPHRRFTRGMPPRTKGDMAFLQHMVEVANDKGMVGVVMPHGVLFRGGSEKTIRQALLEEDLFEAVIGLPAKLFFGTGIPGSILILNKKKPSDRKRKVLFIDASPEGFFKEGSNRNYLRFVDIMQAAAVFRGYAQPGEVREQIQALRDEWISGEERKRQDRLSKLYTKDQGVIDDVNQEIDEHIAAYREAAQALLKWLDQKHPGGRTSLEKYAQVVPLEEIIGENDFNLNISRYVDPTDPAPQLDVAKELKKLRNLEDARNKAEEKMNLLLKELGYDS